jgi:hypothetical protein
MMYILVMFLQRGALEEETAIEQLIGERYPWEMALPA